MPDDDTIAVLPPQVANQIAAGEVIERPASVVKELLENALDARATRVEIFISQGGRSLIEIADNGSGMNRANAQTAFQRQATSKLRGIHDLQELATLGFRGEALPSIASVSRTTLLTCRQGETLGTELSIHAGDMDEPRDAARPHGATFTVRDLFFNVPARKKFLRSVPTEQGHIKQMVVSHALANPGVAFVLKADGREILRAPVAESLKDRIADLFSPAFAEELRPFAARDLEASVHGFVAPPHLATRGESEYYIFVNNRPAAAPIVYQAIRQSLPDPERKPALFLFIELDPSLVDVNVHPAKREVRFKNPMAVRDLITRALLNPEWRASVPASRELDENPNGVSSSSPGLCERSESTLGDASPPHTTPTGLPPSTNTASHGEATPLGLNTTSRLTQGGANTRDPGLNDATPLGLANTPADAPFLPSAFHLQPSPPPAPLLPSAFCLQPSNWWECSVLAQSSAGYILLETSSGLITLDPQAARERILFEQLTNRVHASAPNSQRLLIPETATLSPRHGALIRQNLDAFESMGIRVAELTPDTFIVEALPPELLEFPARALLVEIAQDLETLGPKRGAEHWREDALVRAASRAASGQTKPMTRDEINALVAALARCAMPYTSPRGRPVMILTSFNELARKFGK